MNLEAAARFEYSPAQGLCARDRSHITYAMYFPKMYVLLWYKTWNKTYRTYSKPLPVVCFEGEFAGEDNGRTALAALNESVFLDVDSVCIHHVNADSFC